MPFAERRTLVGALGGPKNVQAIERYKGPGVVDDGLNLRGGARRSGIGC